MVPINSKSEIPKLITSSLKVISKYSLPFSFFNSKLVIIGAVLSLLKANVLEELFNKLSASATTSDFTTIEKSPSETGNNSTLKFWLSIFVNVEITAFVRLKSSLSKPNISLENWTSITAGNS